MIIQHEKAGTADVSVIIRIIDSADGTPETGVTSATSGIDLEYRRDGAAVVNITEADLSALTDAHSDGGMLHIGAGYYRLDLPDAAVTTGSKKVLVTGQITGMVVIGCLVHLIAVDLFDTVRLGLTALPNAAAEAAGGLYTRGTGAGQINQAANGQVDSNAVAISGDSAAADNAEAHFDGTGYKDIDNVFVIRSATAQAGAAGNITLDASASAVDDFYNGALVDIISGTGIGQVRQISDYVGSTKVATVSSNWITNPDNTSVFAILPSVAAASGSAPTASEVADAVWDEATSGHTTSGTFGEQAKTDVDAILVEALKIGTPAGASVSADLLTIDNLVDDLESRIGTPSNLGGGATVSANLSDIEGQTDDIGTAGAGLTAIPWNAAWDAEVQSEVDDAIGATIADSVPADGTRPSVKQALYMLTQFMLERSVSSTTVTVNKPDGTTALFTLTLDSGTAPTSITRAT